MCIKVQRCSKLKKPISLSIQNSVLRLAVCILHPTETQSPNHIQNTKDTPTTTSLQLRHPADQMEASALPCPSSYTAAPRRTAPGHSNLCPSYLTTLITIHSSYGCLVKKKRRKKKYVKDRCDELECAWAFFSDNAAMPTIHIQISSIFLSL